VAVAVVTAGPRGHLTRADERAIAKLLAEGDDEQVEDLAHAIRRYELIARDAKARLGKRKVETPGEAMWQGGYQAAMNVVLDVIGEMTAAGREYPPYIVHALREVAWSSQDLAFAEDAADLWSRRDERGGPDCAGAR
jgi:hypothetical protein